MATAQELAKQALAAAQAQAPAANGDTEKKTPRVPKEPLVTSGPSKAEMLALVATGKMKVEDYIKAESGSKTGVQMGIGEAGWPTLYYPGCRFPVNMPVECLEFIMSEGGRKAIEKFIAKHNAKFSRK